MSDLTIRHGCKVNLYLHVLGRRADGYHDIESLFVPLTEPYDDIHISLYDNKGNSSSQAKGPGKLRCTFANSASNGIAVRPIDTIDAQNNTLTRAYELYTEATGFAPYLDIRVHKGIPHGAGLGGGSANAAALLGYLQDTAALCGFTPLSETTLVALAAQIGADVPFFLLNGPALASGIGERLSPCPAPFPAYFLLLVCPRVSVSTAWAFKALDEQRDTRSPDKQARALYQENTGLTAHSRNSSLYDDFSNFEKKDTEILTSGLPRASKFLAHANDFRNDFESVVFAHFPELEQLYNRLCNSGAEIVRMSGTGASLFALYKEKRIAQNAAKMLANENVSVYTQRLPAG